MKHIELDTTVFKAHLEKDPTLFLIDIREEYEHEDYNIGGKNIPMGEVLSRLDELKGHSEIYIYCRSGKRSKAIAYSLCKELGDCTIYSCAGGLSAYPE